MKLSLALGERKTLSRQTAWGCFTTNLALPGFGSLVAGRAVGYPQAALTLIGFTLSLVFFVRFFYWYVANRGSLNDPQDPLAGLETLWNHVRWPLLGIGIFFFSALWALTTSLSVLREAREKESRSIPPPLV